MKSVPTESKPDITTATKKTQQERDKEDIALIQKLLLKGEPLDAVILKVRGNTAKLVNNKIMWTNSFVSRLVDTPAINEKADTTFWSYYGTQHNDSPELTEIVSDGNGEIFSVTIRKIGQTELYRKEVELMIKDPSKRPIPYLERPEVDGIKPTLKKYFDDTYGRFRDAGAIYLNEIRFIDPDLYRNLGSVGKHITSTMKKCKDQVSDDIALVSKVSVRAARVLRSSYGKKE